MANKISLTSSMRSALFQIKEEGRLASPTNTTLCALETRGLVECHAVPGRLVSVMWKLTDAGRELRMKLHGK